VAEPHPQPAAPLDEPTRRKILISVMGVMVLAALDSSIVAIALPTIGEALGDFELSPWIVTIYLVTATMMTPIYGKLADIHGRQPILLVGVIIFVIGSVLCALAASMMALIIGRAIQGVGGGALLSIPQTVVADIVPPTERGRYQAYFATGFGAALVAGPLLGGFFASQLHWSLIFWINLPIIAVALALMHAPLRHLPVHHRPHKLDILGAALMAVAAVTFLLALDWASHHGWASNAVMVLLVISALAWVAFALRNLYAPEPLLPFAVLKEPVVASATIASFFGVGAFIGLTLAVPAFLQFALGFATGESALAFMVLTFATVVGSVLTGKLMATWRRYRLIGVFGHGAAAAMLVILALFPVQLPFAVIEILFAIIGVGLGTVYPLGTVAVQSAVAVHHLGIATATLGFIRSLGGAVGAATLGGIALGGAAVGAEVSGTFALAFATAAVLAALGAICFALMEDRPLRATVGAGPAPARAVREEER
jgi:EmrB/QacA subfamily drug resistance transporter